MASVNKVILVGNLGRDPETRYSTSGAAICNITIATSRQWKDKASGEKREETEWHRVVFYDRLAEIAGEYLKKGRPVYIEGRLKTRKWQDKEGEDRYTTEIIAEEMQLLGSREGGRRRQWRCRIQRKLERRGSALGPCRGSRRRLRRPRAVARKREAPTIWTTIFRSSRAPAVSQLSACSLRLTNGRPPSLGDARSPLH